MEAYKKGVESQEKTAVRDFHSNFVTELKTINPSKCYQICKKIGTGDQMNDRELNIECLSGLSDAEYAEAVGQGFAAVSSQYQPVDLDKLPAYLPSLPPLPRSRSTRCTPSYSR